MTKQDQNGFSLTEMLVAVSIAGILGSIATTSFVNQLSKGQQSEAHALITQIIGQTSAFNDEYGKPAEGWSDLDKIATILTSTGVATGSNFSTIKTPQESYAIIGNRSGNKYIFNATPILKGGSVPPDDEINNPGSAPPIRAANYNIVSCINVATGASDIQIGSGTTAASQANLRCP